MANPYDLEAMYRLGRKCLSCQGHEAELAALRAQLAAAQAERDASRQRVHESFKRRNADGSCVCPYCTGNVEEVYEHAANLELDKCSLEQKLTESEATVARLREELTDWQLVADGVKHHFGCPNNATTGTQTLDEPCLRCQVASVREAARREAFDAALRAFDYWRQRLGPDERLSHWAGAALVAAFEQLRDAPPEQPGNVGPAAPAGAPEGGEK